MTAAKTILIADDDSDLADALAVRCRQLGFNVVIAYDGLAASSQIAERPFDLVCVDVNMPFGNGIDVCRMLAADDTLASLPVVVLTCRSDEETVRRCRLLGVHYVLKSHDLWERIKPLLLELLQSSPLPNHTRLEHAESSANRFANDCNVHGPCKGAKL